MQKLFLLFGLCLLLACGNKGNNEADLKKYEKTKAKLAKREKENPVEFLRVVEEKNKNLIGQTVIKGVIENTASVASYKDVRLKLLYYKNSVLVANHEEEYKDVIRPNNTKEFKAKYFTPKGTDSIAVSVMKAQVAE